VRAHAQGEVEIGQRRAHGVGVLVVDDEEHARVVDVGHVDRDAALGDPTQHVAVEVGAIGILGEPLDDPAERHVAQHGQARHRMVGVDRRVVVDRRADVAAQTLHHVRRARRARQLGGFVVHDLGAVSGQLGPSRLG